MTSRRSIAVGALAALFGLCSAALLAQQGQGQEPGQQEPSMDEMMQAWMKYATPGEHHKHLDSLAGHWTYKGIWHTPEGPQEFSGRTEYEWILGGRFLTEEVKGQSLMGENAPPFEGFGILGYDNYKQKHFSIWMDNMMTMVMTSEGTCNGHGKVITCIGTYDDPMTGSKKTEKSVLRIAGKDRHTYEMYEQGPDGKERKTLEINYTRVGGAEEDEED